MGESTNQIERDIAAERNELGRNLQLLESKAKSLGDWRTYFRSHPFAMMAVALGGGVMLGVLTSRGSSDSEFRAEGYSTPRDADSSYPSTSPFAASAARARRQFGDTWDHIADALLGVASAKAIEFVSEKIPGFREQFDTRNPEQRSAFSSSVRNG
jgi:hypothetical protein